MNRASSLYQFYRHGTPSACLVVNDQPPPEELTVPIVGVPRGGTTAVAAAIHALGLPMGNPADLSRFTFEDQTMNRNDMGLQLSYIARRNKKHAKWGWKDPTAVNTVSSLFFSLRNPRMIMVFRDMLASIEGEMRFDVANAISPPRTFQDLAQMTINWWASNMRFLAHTTFPVLMISYERMLRDPDEVVTKLAEFTGLRATIEQRRDAIARINPSGGYLRIDEKARPVSVEPDQSRSNTSSEASPCQES